MWLLDTKKVLDGMKDGKEFSFLSEHTFVFFGDENELKLIESYNIKPAITFDCKNISHSFIHECMERLREFDCTDNKSVFICANKKFNSFLELIGTWYVDLLYEPYEEVPTLNNFIMNGWID